MEFTKLVQKWQLYSAHRALLSCIFWLILWHLFTSSNGATKEEERVALLQLRDSLNRPNGSELVNEWVGNDYCNWYGIRCDRNLLVLQIYLPSRRQLGLGTWYPNATLLSHFENLESLYLPGNRIGSWIMPEDTVSTVFEGAILVKHLSQPCIYTSFIRSELGMYYQLYQVRTWNVLSIFSSNISYTLPAWLALCELKNLRALDLNNNSINDENIPPCLLRNLSSLEALYLSQNHLTNSPRILAALCGLRNLKVLNLRDNFLDESSIPSCLFNNGICRLQKLKTLSLYRNLIQGEIDPCLSKMTSLVNLVLSFNHFQGNFPSFIFSNLTSLETLFISDNEFDGTLSFATFANLSNLLQIDLSNNDLMLSSTIGNSFPELRYLNTSSNAFKGEIPSSYGNLTMSNNFLQGKIPINLRQNHTSLAQLILSGNNFHETIPSFSNMSNLAGLHLRNVGFGGSITRSLVNLPVLEVLDISWNNLSVSIPDWFHTMPNLAIILLSRNQFHGTIPISLCQIQKLHFLDLSANSLSGFIPTCLNNITSWKKESALHLPYFTWISVSFADYRVKVPLTTKGNSLVYEGTPLYFMTGLDLSMNQLTGEIPSQLGELGALHSLNLSFNILTGHIPKSFSIMEKLESLDLSHNNLVGSIPPEIVQLHFISTFNVSFNNLSGSIPFENNFRTFDESSYRGNKGLCGLPLDTACTSPNKKPPQQDEEEERAGIAESNFFFFSCIAVSYVVGFWVVILPLVVSKNWRRKHYAAVDSCIYICCNKFPGFLTLQDATSHTSEKRILYMARYSDCLQEVDASHQILIG
ncbi:hypothetical protein ACH5RR_034762 [Cinchona calisaya]|uniref:Leucine-rich repeat-containing N-terminal plant-type domain-containing protein n=1 Tax=Cinchona calisaya TaxID=153742 RepID=A0ABD2YBV9_9GENT